jgi:Spy/CpxP family protein refolding chaperone
MKSLRLFSAVTGVLFLLSCGMAGAQQEKQDQAQQKAQLQRGQFQKGQFQLPFGGGGLLSQDALDKLKLTADQKEKYDKIAAEYGEKQKASGEKIREAFQSKDADKIREALQGLRTDADKVRTEYLGRVESLLTAEQKTTFNEVKNQRGRFGVGGLGGFGGPAIPGQVLSPRIQAELGLTDDQKAKVEAAQKEAESKIMNILTEDQRKKLDELKKAGPGRRLNLQGANIQGIDVQQFRGQLQKLLPNLRKQEN